MFLSAPRFSPAGLRRFRSCFFGVALLLAIATPMGPVAAETYKPSTTLIHRIVTV